MCGIYGILNLKAGCHPGRRTAGSHGKAVHHRGPDDEGVYLGRGVALGMRRLSIIDPRVGISPSPTKMGQFGLFATERFTTFRRCGRA